MSDQYEYERRKIARELLTDLDYKWHVNEVNHFVQHRLIGYIAERMVETQEVTVTLEPPTFLEWLLRRKRYTQVVVDCRAALKNPPPREQEHEVNLYYAQQKEHER